MTQIISIYIVLDGHTNFCKAYKTREQAEQYLLTVDNPQNFVIQETQLL